MADSAEKQPKPTPRPARPFFSSGPCAKRPGWSAAQLDGAIVGRSHRSDPGRQQLSDALQRTHALLQLPPDYLCGILPASDTGAFEAAMWSLLGARGVDLLEWENFGAEWSRDARDELRLADLRILSAPYGALPDLRSVDFDRDVVFTANGTTSGVRIPNYDWIAAGRAGLTLVDATSAAFAQPIDWGKVDVATFSWQKVLGGEAAHGVLVLSPRAVARLEAHTPSWPLPKIFRLTENGQLRADIFCGHTINTPSMLALEDYCDALAWAEHIGGLSALHARSDANAHALWRWIEATPWIENLAQERANWSNTSVCMVFADQSVQARGAAFGQTLATGIAARLEAEGAAFDVANYRTAPPGLRVWCGATVEAQDIIDLTPWLTWAYDCELAGLSA